MFQQALNKSTRSEPLQNEPQADKKQHKVKSPEVVHYGKEKELQALEKRIYSEIIENRKIATSLKAEITKAIQRNEDPTSVLKLAIKCISLMTNEKLFYDANIKQLDNLK